MIEFLKGKGIKPIIDIKNQWRGETTKQYKDTDIVYTYDGKVYYVDDYGNMQSLKYLGYDKVKDTNGNVIDIFGYPDCYKLQSSMTLFAVADPSTSVFQDVLEKFYEGKGDENTLKLLKKM